MDVSGGSTARLIAGHLGDEGQSVLEFLCMLPLLVGLTVILLRVNTLMQISIVSQQYARNHIQYLTFNSAWYPEKRFIPRFFGGNNRNKNRMVMGVAGNAIPLDESTAEPETTRYRITRSKKAAQGANNDGSIEADKRAEVRIRDTVSLCTPSHNVQGPDGPMLLAPGALRDPLSSTAFIYCRSEMDE